MADKQLVRPLVQPRLHQRDRQDDPTGTPHPGEFTRARVAQRIGASTYVLTVGPKVPLTPVT